MNVHTRSQTVTGDLRIRDGFVARWKKFELTAPGTTAATALGLTLNAQDIVFDAAVLVRTVGAATVLDIGLDATTSGDADGFVDGLNVASSGWVFPGVAVSTSGSPGRFYSANTKGVLLSDFTVGTTVANVFGLFNAKPYAAGVVADETKLVFAVDTTVAVKADVYLLIGSIYSSEGY